MFSYLVLILEQHENADCVPDLETTLKTSNMGKQLIPTPSPFPLGFQRLAVFNLVCLLSFPEKSHAVHGSTSRSIDSRRCGIQLNSLGADVSSEN